MRDLILEFQALFKVYAQDVYDIQMMMETQVRPTSVAGKTAAKRYKHCLAEYAPLIVNLDRIVQLPKQWVHRGLGRWIA